MGRVLLVKLIWQSVFISAVACIAILGLSFLLGRFVPEAPGRNGMTWMLCLVLVVLAGADWIPVVLVGRILVKKPEGLLQDQFQRLLVEALTASFLAIVGFNYLIGSPLPRGVGFFLLVIAVLLVSVPSLHFWLKTYREA